jgi:hypothetical protein
MKKTQRTYLTLLLILFLGFIFQFNYINEFPSHIHAWAQSDRYALALGFVENNLNLFKPQTFVMNPQFPGGFKVPSDVSITAVDFPIHEYIVAIIMKMTGINSPWIFRLYTLLYSFAGLFFLYRLSYLLTSDYFKSLFIVIFAATSPVFVYYQSGFLPTIPSLSNIFIGFYFYIKHLKQKDRTSFVMALGFITLATLNRTTFAVCLGAMLGTELIQLIRGQNKVSYKILPVFISVSVFFSYFLYNNYLRKEYGSIFLNHFQMPSSMEEVKEILKEVYRNWKTQYFSGMHYFLMLLTIASASVFIFKNKSHITLPMPALTLLFLLFLGYIVFAILMLKQFPAHDYYFLDSFFFPVILLLIVSLSFVPVMNIQTPRMLKPVILLLLIIPLTANAYHSQKERRIIWYWDRTDITIDNFQGADKFLDSLNIAPDAKILVIDANAPNIPFILMKRKGYAVMSTSKENMQEAMRWKYDYIITQNSFFVSDIYSVYLEILTKLEKIADNGKITISVLSKEGNPQSLMTFLGLDKKSPVFKGEMTFDTLNDSHWQNIQATPDYFHSGSKGGLIDVTNEFGLTYKSGDILALKEKNRTLLFSAYFLGDTIRDIHVVVAINGKEHGIYYNTYNLKDFLKKQNLWEKADLLFQLPKVTSDTYEFGIYLWNPGRNHLYFDDFTFTIY